MSSCALPGPSAASSSRSVAPRGRVTTSPASAGAAARSVVKRTAAREERRRGARRGLERKECSWGHVPAARAVLDALHEVDVDQVERAAEGSRGRSSRGGTSVSGWGGRGVAWGGVECGVAWGGVGWGVGQGCEGGDVLVGAGGCGGAWRVPGWSEAAAGTRHVRPPELTLTLTATLTLPRQATRANPNPNANPNLTTSGHPS